MEGSVIIRRVDELGRVVLPVEFRRSLGIEERDPLEVSLEGECILLRRHEISCIFCGGAVDLSTYRGKSICAGCRRALLDDEE